MSELMDAVKLLEDAMNERKILDELIEHMENELFRLVQRRRVSPTVSPPKKIGRPKGRKDSKPRKPERWVTTARAPVPLPFSQLTPEQQAEKKREWGRKGKAAAMANRAAKQNGAAIPAG